MLWCQETEDYLTHYVVYPIRNLEKKGSDNRATMTEKAYYATVDIEMIQPVESFEDEDQEELIPPQDLNEEIDEAFQTGKKEIVEMFHDALGFEVFGSTPYGDAGTAKAIGLNASLFYWVEGDMDEEEAQRFVYQEVLGEMTTDGFMAESLGITGIDLTEEENASHPMKEVRWA